MPPSRFCLSQVLNKLELPHGRNKLAKLDDDKVDPVSKVLTGMSDEFRAKAQKELTQLSNLHKANRHRRG